MRKERLSGAYRLSAFYLAKVVSDYIAALHLPLMIVCGLYFFTGLTIAPGNFFAFIGTILLAIFSAAVSTGAADSGTEQGHRRPAGGGRDGKLARQKRGDGITAECLC